MDGLGSLSLPSSPSSLSSLGLFDLPADLYLAITALSPAGTWLAWLHSKQFRRDFNADEALPIFIERSADSTELSTSVFGRLQSIDGAPSLIVFTPSKKIREISWHHRGRPHRVGLPAKIFLRWERAEWFVHGAMHRDGGLPTWVGRPDVGMRYDSTGRCVSAYMYAEWHRAPLRVGRPFAGIIQFHTCTCGLACGEIVCNASHSLIMGHFAVVKQLIAEVIAKYG